MVDSGLTNSESILFLRLRLYNTCVENIVQNNTI